MTGNQDRGSDLLWVAAIVVSVFVHAGVGLALIRYYDPFGGAIADDVGPRDIVVSLLAPGDGGLSMLNGEPTAPAAPGDTAQSVPPAQAEAVEAAQAEAAEPTQAEAAEAESLQPAEMDPDENATAVEPELPGGAEAEQAEPLASADQIEAADADTLAPVEEDADMAGQAEPPVAETPSEPEAIESIAADDIVAPASEPEAAPEVTPEPEDTPAPPAPEVLETPPAPEAPEARDAVIARPLAPLSGNDVATPVAIAPPSGTGDVTSAIQSIPQAQAGVAPAIIAQNGSAQTVVEPVRTFARTTEVARPVGSQAAGVDPQSVPAAPDTDDGVAVGDPAQDSTATPAPPADDRDAYQLAVAVAPSSGTPARPGIAATERLAPRVMIPRPRVPASSFSAVGGGTPDSRPDDETVRRLITLIRGNFSDTCLLAVPKRTQDGRLLLLAFGARENALRDLSDAVQGDLGAPILTRTLLVNTRQCPALKYLRENPGYPTFNLTIELAQPQIESGAVLQGYLNNAAGRNVSFLLVDDNGVVQDLGKYLRYSDGRIKFAIPMRRSGANRDTSQLLVAVASRTRPEVLNSLIGRRAEDFFPALKAEIGISNLVAVLPFDVN